MALRQTASGRSRMAIVSDRRSQGDRRGRVVLADSHLNLLEGVHGLLGNLFASVLMVADESSLLDVVATQHPDLVVVDLSLPRESDVDAVRRLMACHPEVRVLVLSVDNDQTVADLLLGAGAKGFVLKRALAGDLKPAVEKVLQGGVYVSPSVSNIRISEM